MIDDTRDLRDPQKLGEAILEQRSFRPTTSIIKIAEGIKPIPDYSHDEDVLIRYGDPRAIHQAAIERGEAIYLEFGT